jgi:hypothetical protein
MFQACKLVKATKQVVCSMKSDDSFESFVKAAVEQCILCSISVPTWAQSLALSSHGTTDQSHLQAGSEVPAQDIIGVSRVSNRSNQCSAWLKIIFRHRFAKRVFVSPI